MAIEQPTTGNKSGRLHYPYKHGESRSIEYKTYHRMKQRCYNPGITGFKHYGGRGITVCEEWHSNYFAFLAHMGRRPSPEHSLDRINNNGNYEPGNCRWATASEQMWNRRKPACVVRGTPKTALRIAYNGRTLPVAEWCKELGINTSSFYWRLDHWPFEDVFANGKRSIIHYKESPEERSERGRKGGEASGKVRAAAKARWKGKK